MAISLEHLTRPELRDPATLIWQRKEISDDAARGVALGLAVVPDIALAAGEVVDLGPYQTPIRSQGGRDTCYAFAVCAAMEAAYRRLGVVVILSPQYAFHVNKSFYLFPDYTTNGFPMENNTSMTGFQGMSNIVEKLARCAVPTETDVPYLDAAAMKALMWSIPAAGDLTDMTRYHSQEAIDAFEYDPRHIPPAGRHQARYRVRTWKVFGAPPSLEDIKKVLRSGYEVVADIPGHCWLIVGYDDRRRIWLVKNSWGEQGFREVSWDSPDYATKWKPTGGHWIEEVEPPDAAPQKRAFWIGRWQMDHDGHIGELVLRRFTNTDRPPDDDAAPTKLGSYYRDGHRYDVNGSISVDGQTLDCWVAPTTGRVEPGSEIGQRFVFSLFAAGDHAAGITSANGEPYGARLDRSPRATTGRRGFQPSWWLDSWAMNHDGWRGILRIFALDPLLATWEGPDKVQLQVTGALDPTAPHRLALEIPFNPADPQHFELFCHTWEDGVFSGRSSWHGTTYGVVGDRYTEPVYPPFAPPGPAVEPAMLYAVEPSGLLRWYRHDGAATGAGVETFRGPRTVGRGWAEMRTVLPGGGDAIYAIDPDGDLYWFRHRGFNTGVGVDEPGGWEGRRTVGTGWTGFERVFAGGDGVLYVITADGTLRWYKHLAVETGGGLDTPGSWAPPRDVGVGWSGLEHVFSTGAGVIYTIAADGVLRWYRHVGIDSGAGLETPGAWVGPRDVGVGWGGLKAVFAAAKGVIYAIEPDGTLVWFRHDGWTDGRGIDAPGAWQGRRQVGSGWAVFPQVFALLPRTPTPPR